MEKNVIISVDIPRRKFVGALGVGLFTAACGGSRSPRGELVPPAQEASPQATATVPEPTASPLPPKATATSTPTAVPLTREQVMNKYAESPHTDTLSPEQLQDEYYTQILNTKTIGLQLRNGMKDFPLYKNLKEASGQRDLVIVLVDGPYIHSQFLTEDQKKASPDMVKVLETLESTLVPAKQAEFLNTKIRNQMQSEYKANLAALEKKFSNGLIDRDTYAKLKEAYSDHYRPYYKEWYGNQMPYTPDELYKHAMGFGQHYPLNGQDVSGKPAKENYIWVAVGETDMKKVEQAQLLHLDTAYLDPSQSFPSPEDFTYKVDNGDPTRLYTILDFTPGPTFLHEQVHLTGIGHTSKPKNTDEVTMDNYRVASQAISRGDDSKYFAFFTTPRGVVIV